MERMRDLLQVTQVLTAHSGHQIIHKSWLEREKKSGRRGLCEQSLGAGNHHSTEETLVSRFSPSVTCSARSYEEGDPDGGSPRVLCGRARRLHSKQGPTAQRSRPEQAQPGGSDLRGPGLAIFGFQGTGRLLTGSAAHALERGHPQLLSQAISWGRE